MRYRLQTGSFAWVIHRLTGVGLTLYLFLHLYVLSHLKDPKAYASLIATMERPLIRASEGGLLVLVIAHAFNGLRLSLIDLGMPTSLHKRVFWYAFALGAALAVYGSSLLMRGVH